MSVKTCGRQTQTILNPSTVPANCQYSLLSLLRVRLSTSQMAAPTKKLNKFYLSKFTSPLPKNRDSLGELSAVAEGDASVWLQFDEWRKIRKAYAQYIYIYMRVFYIVSVGASLYMHVWVYVYVRERFVPRWATLYYVYIKNHSNNLLEDQNMLPV